MILGLKLPWLTFVFKFNLLALKWVLVARLEGFFDLLEFVGIVLQSYGLGRLVIWLLSKHLAENSNFLDLVPTTHITVFVHHWLILLLDNRSYQLTAKFWVFQSRHIGVSWPIWTIELLGVVPLSSSASHSPSLSRSSILIMDDTTLITIHSCLLVSEHLKVLGIKIFMV